jgi:hypothetical protein
MTEHTIVSGMGRSGTRWLATLFTKATPEGVWGRHEPHFTIDHDALVADLKGDIEGVAKYVTERAELSRAWARGKNATHVIEVNSGLRHVAKELGRHLEAPVVHLVRDPRAVIASLWARQHYRDGAEGYVQTVRPYHGTWAENWDTLTRFQKLVWLWWDAAAHMFGCPTVRLEDLTNPDNEELRILIEHFVGIEYTDEIDQFKNTRINPTPKAKQDEMLGPWEEWPDEDKEFLIETCGTLMEQFGYEV